MHVLLSNCSLINILYSYLWLAIGLAYQSCPLACSIFRTLRRWCIWVGTHVPICLHLSARPTYLLVRSFFLLQRVHLLSMLSIHFIHHCLLCTRMFLVTNVVNNNHSTNHPSISPNFQQLKIYFANSRSLCNKIYDLDLILFSQKYDVLIFCEMWLTVATQNSLLSSGRDYSVHRVDRPNRIGGVA